MGRFLTAVLALASIWLRIAAADLPSYLPGAVITTSGDGCPTNEADGKYVNATGDFEQMDFTLHNFTVVYGANDSVALRTVACEEHIDVEDPPEGWQVSPDNFTVTGFVVLEPGTTITVYVDAYWSADASNTVSVSKQYQNTGTTTISADVEFEAEVELWSTCVAANGSLSTLNLDLRVALTSTDTNAFAYFGPLELNGEEETSVKEDVSYKWQAC